MKPSKKVQAHSSLEIPLEYNQDQMLFDKSRLHPKKEKFTDCSNRKKIQILTLAPEDWTIQKTVDFSNVNEYAVKQVRKLKEEKMTFSNPFQLLLRRIRQRNKKNVLLNAMKEMMSVACVQVKRIVLASEIKSEPATT